MNPQLLTAKWNTQTLLSPQSIDEADQPASFMHPTFISESPTSQGFPSVPGNWAGRWPWCGLSEAAESRVDFSSTQTLGLCFCLPSWHSLEHFDLESSGNWLWLTYAENTVFGGYFPLFACLPLWDSKPWVGASDLPNKTVYHIMVGAGLQLGNTLFWLWWEVGSPDLRHIQWGIPQT